MTSADFALIKSACAEVYEQLGHSLPKGREFNYRYPDDVESTPYLPLTCAMRETNGSTTSNYRAFGS